MPSTTSVAITVKLTDDEVAAALMQIILKRTGVEDDAGCDWGTAGRLTCIGNVAWTVSHDVRITHLVDAFNVLKYGEVKRF